MTTDVYWKFANVKGGPEGAGSAQLPEAACAWGRGQHGQRVPRCLAPPEPCCSPFPGPGASWALSKRGCLLTPGLAAFFVPLTFSTLYAGPFYGGFKGGWNPPPCPWKSRFASHAPLPCTDILGEPTEHIWVACRDNSCVTCPRAYPPSPPHCLAPPAALSTSVKWV